MKMTKRTLDGKPLYLIRATRELRSILMYERWFGSLNSNCTWVSNPIEVRVKWARDKDSPIVRGSDHCMWRRNLTQKTLRYLLEKKYAFREKEKAEIMEFLNL